MNALKKSQYSFVDRKIKNWRTKHWQLLLREYKNEIYHYHRIWKTKYNIDEVPYYYSERTNISILASGAVRKGYLILEEYPVSKLGGRGRVDLWIGDAKLKFNEIIEAKQCWNIGDIENKLVQAKKDRGRAIADFDEYKASLVFVCHWIEKKDIPDTEKIVMGWIKKIKKVKYDVALVLYPKKFWAVHGSGKNKNNYFPGVTVLVKLAKKKLYKNT
jgi:hypothetical protein